MRILLAGLATALLGVPSSALKEPEPALIATITTGQHPCGVVSAFGSIWVANDGGTLVRIDPRTNRVRKRIRVGTGACFMTADARALWIANYKRGLVRVTPRGRVKRIAVGATPDNVLVAFGRVWVTTWGAGKVAVVDPQTLRVVRRIDVGSKPAGLAARDGAVWVGFTRDVTSIARVSPGTYRVDQIDVGVPEPRGFVAGTKDLWIQANTGDLVHFDPVTRRVLAHLEVGRTLAQGAVAHDGRIWIPDKEQNLIFRVDPVKQRVIDSFASGPGAYTTLRAYGSMWVTSYAGRDVRRYRP
jgi:YVTN family beta-propeller protein